MNEGSRRQKKRNRRGNWLEFCRFLIALPLHGMETDKGLFITLMFYLLNFILTFFRNSLILNKYFDMSF